MIRFKNVSKVFGTGVAGLSDLSLSIEKGEFIFIVGPTGSGKTTFLKLINRELLPTSGIITISEIEITKLPAKKVPRLRKNIGIVFQDLKLLMDRTIYENVMLPLEIAGKSLSESKKKAEELLSQVGVSEHKEKFPIQLSGGELQRVAIARALALSPDIILVDEPTGNLDNATAFGIVDLLNSINKEFLTTIIMVTHNQEVVKKYKHRTVSFHKGKIIEDKKK